MKTLLRGSLVCALLLSTASAANDSTIIGTVTDAQSRGPVADVVVTVSSPVLPGEQTTLTDAQGNYRLPQLPAGEYTLRFEMEGFHPYARQKLQLRPNRKIRVNAELLPASLDNVVEVVGSPPNLDPGASAACTPLGDDVFIKRIAVPRPVGKERSSEDRTPLPPDAGSTTTDINVDQEFIKRIVVARPARRIRAEPEFSRDRDRMPSWVLSRQVVFVPDGTPQLVYRAPSPDRDSSDFGSR
ncbi:carboxypeptidase-like regulatory domain-containing protein [Pyxidicoccus sp. 3LG]